MKESTNKSDECWNAIYEDSGMRLHDFSQGPFVITADDIKGICQARGLKRTEPRILCKQDTRESRPKIFKDNGLFILPKKNKVYYVLKGEGYVDIPDITSDVEEYNSDFGFELRSSKVGDSEMQYLDFAYANSLIRSFMNDPTLVLTIRGRKYTPSFEFRVGNQRLEVESVQTEVDAGYEGRDNILLIEAKNTNAKNEVIRQLFYPYLQWKKATGKQVHLLFFERRMDAADVYYYVWQYEFTDDDDYNSIHLVKSKRFKIINHFA